MKKFFFLSLILSLTLPLLSCSQGKLDPYDEQNGLSISETKDGIIRDRTKEKKLAKSEKGKGEAPIPSVSKLIMAPPPPVIGGEKIISFSVTDQAPLKDVLIELGRMAQIDIDLDPSISGGIILNAKNRPLKEVIDRISDLGELRYSYQNGVLRFERDTPYSKNYFVDYLFEGSLWKDVESNISAILNAGLNTSATNIAAPGAVAPNAAAASNVVPITPTTPTTPGAPTTNTPTAHRSSFSSNKSAGIITVYATAKQQDSVTKYLADVAKSASAQVLIEAKVVEVRLTDTFKTGINWNLIGKKNTLTGTNGYIAGGPLSFVTTEVLNSDLGASISALESFGTTRTLSSPRIHATNNQKAILDFANKLVYFTLLQTQSAASNGAVANVVATTRTSTRNEEKIGVQLTITPSINLKTNEITMSIKPTLSIKSAEIIDPASPFDPDTGEITFENKIPVIQTREITTVAKIQSGNIFVIGGLMTEDATNTDEGIPFLNRIPLLGWLFKSINKNSTLTETVIFIKATIVGSGAPAEKVDRDIQNKFDTNRRKFF